MNQEHLQSYLHDHLAGATTGLELIDFLLSAHEGKGPPRRFFADLRAEVKADQETLRDLVDALGFAPGSTRQAAAWMLEKLVRIKFLFAGPGKGSLGELEALEALALGIEGKAALWAALAVVPDAPPALCALDLANLQTRAREQRTRVEARRLEVAANAFGPPD